MAIEMYQKMPTLKSLNPRVTMGKATINFNRSAVEKFLVPLAQKLNLGGDCIPYVEAGFDRDTLSIHLFPVEEQGKTSLCVQQKKNAGAKISVVGFLKQFSLSSWTHQMMDCRLDEKTLVLTTTGRAIAGRIYTPKKPLSETPPQPAAAQPKRGRPARKGLLKIESTPGKKRVEYECSHCGCFDKDWKITYPILGHPKCCPECNASAFEAMA